GTVIRKAAKTNSVAASGPLREFRIVRSIVPSIVAPSRNSSPTEFVSAATLAKIEESGPMRALVLSGGASFGAYQAGVWKALREQAWEPDLIVGVSIGAVNAFALSHGANEDEMAYVWRELPGVIGGEAHGTLSPWRHLQLFREWLDAVV